jgi:RNA polymerase sigma-70 factor (sigma-E family)
VRVLADTAADLPAVSAPVTFEAFVTYRSGSLLRLALLLTGDPGRAEDLLQTALMKAWRAWSRVDGDPEPYVRRIMVTTATSTWRRRWTGEIPVRDPHDGAAPDGEAAEVAALDLRAALLHLPARQRACVVLRYVEDLTEQQTADALGCSVGTVKSQTAKALARLRIDPRLDASAEGRDA